MTARKQWAIVGVIVVVLGAGLWGATRMFGDQLFPVGVGSSAPDFRAKALGAPTVKSLADYKGQVVLLNIWATWCVPCRVEMPSLQRLQQAYADSGLKIVAVSIDEEQPDDSIRAFAKELGLTFEILRDSTLAISKAYQTTGVPESFVIAKDGVIRKKWIGRDDWDSPGNRALVSELLGLSKATVVPADTAQVGGVTGGDDPR